MFYLQGMRLGIDGHTTVALSRGDGTWQVKNARTAHPWAGSAQDVTRLDALLSKVELQGKDELWSRLTGALDELRALREVDVNRTALLLAWSGMEFLSPVRSKGSQDVVADTIARYLSALRGSTLTRADRESEHRAFMLEIMKLRHKHVVRHAKASWNEWVIEYYRKLGVQMLADAIWVVLHHAATEPSLRSLDDITQHIATTITP